MAREEKIHQTPYDKKAQVDNKGCKLYLCTRLCVALLITPLLLPPPLFLVSSHFSAFYSFFKKHLHPWQCFQSRSSLLHVRFATKWSFVLQLHLFQVWLEKSRTNCTMLTVGLQLVAGSPGLCRLEVVSLTQLQVVTIKIYDYISCGDL